MKLYIWKREQKCMKIMKENQWKYVQMFVSSVFVWFCVKKKKEGGKERHINAHLLWFFFFCVFFFFWKIECSFERVNSFPMNFLAKFEYEDVCVWHGDVIFMGKFRPWVVWDAYEIVKRSILRWKSFKFIKN